MPARFGPARDRSRSLLPAGNGTDTGSDRVEGNVIAENETGEVYLHNARGHTIEGNLLGTDPSGTFRIGTAIEGIATSFAADNLIAGNVIAGQQDGITIADPGSYCNRIVNNWIGVSKNGALLSNHGQETGIRTYESFNVISGNVIGGIPSTSCGDRPRLPEALARSAGRDRLPLAAHENRRDKKRS